MKKNKLGFTLIELLVVVLIIGVLAAIALPMYQKAVMRSRFNALMPITKAMADANEAYYLEHNNYASNPQDLPVEGKTQYPTGTELSFGNNMEYAYVLASNPSVKNNYIVYQKHSANYPGEIHCEAEEGNAQAEYICESAGATKNIGNILTEGYTTYVLSGNGAGFPPGYNALLAQRVDCSGAEALGFTCTSDSTTGMKKICKNGFCRTRTYNEDGSYTSVTCQADGSNGENVCTSKWISSTYDANGNQLTQRSCNSVDNSGSCTAYSSSGSEWRYDANGNMLSNRSCIGYDSDGNCTNINSNYSYEYAYDANGNKLSERHCSRVDSSTRNCNGYTDDDATDWTYDANGNKLTMRRCYGGVDRSSGICSGYSQNTAYDWTYDENGNMLTQRACDGVDSSGKCMAYTTSITNNYDWTYDENGNKLTQRPCRSFDGLNCTEYGHYSYYTYDANGNMLTERQCSRTGSTGNCTEYNQSYSYDYTYDANGNQLTKRQCRNFDSSGNCTAYDNYSNASYTYDANGNVLTQRGCSSFDGLNCTAYSNSGQDYTYDANGNMLSQRQCSSVDSSGKCTAYGGYSYYYTYDDNGKQMVRQYCSGSNMNTATGECIAYNGEYPAP